MFSYRFDYADIVMKFGENYPEMVKLAHFPVWKRVTIRELNPSRGAYQRIYKDIKKHGFNGTLIDYLGFFALLYLYNLARNSISGQQDNKYKLIKNIKTFLNMYAAAEIIVIRCSVRSFITDRKYFDMMKSDPRIEPVYISQDETMFSLSKDLHETMEEFLINQANKTMKVKKLYSKYVDNE